MKNVTTKQKIAVLGAVMYTTIIGVGMYLMQLSGATYGQPKMVNTLWVIEITLTAITVFFTVKYSSGVNHSVIHLFKKRERIAYI